MDGYVCFFEYGSSVTGNVRGNYSAASFPFFSQVGLSIGEEYLIYLSEADAKLPRFQSPRLRSGMKAAPNSSAVISCSITKRP